MRANALQSLATILLLGFSLSCSEAPKTPTAPAAAQEPPATTTIYDLSKEDITKIPDITSRNISVEGVKLGDRTRDVDKLLGKPLKVDSLQRHYRSAYRNHGIYVEIEKVTGKVTSIYVNTNYYKQAKGGVSELLAHGKLELLKQNFGENPIESKPERTMTLWSYPDKGIQFVHIKQEDTASYTLKLVPPQS
ncbi:MAG: hypothetical protein FJW26_17410 [Acidimicrobiia bacterium]|nr:hypothetical protein [Acidimicrobiia bacterium]